MPARSGSPTKIGLCLPLAYPSPRQRLGKQKASRRTPFIRLKSLRDLGAGEGIRTLDPNLGKLVLYLPARLRRYSKASHVAMRRDLRIRRLAAGHTLRGDFIPYTFTFPPVQFETTYG